MSTIHPLLEEALLASKGEDYPRLDTLLRNCLHSVLEVRVSRHHKAQQLDCAMRHANTLTQLFPDSPAGYRWQGDIYMDYCDYDNAIEAYKRGSTLTHDTQLLQRITDAQARRDTKLDPLQYLPAEIILHIFSFCPEARLTSTVVCHAWRKYLLALEPLWHDVELTLHRKPVSGFWQRGLSYVLKPSLQHLRLTTDSSLCPVLYMLTQANCTHLKTIELEDTTRYIPDLTADGQRSFMSLQFMDGLQRIGAQLTELHITQTMRPRGLLPALLATCPRLVKLTYNLHPTVARYTLPPWDSTCFPALETCDLQHLEWINHWDDGGRADAELLATHCPALHTVWIANFAEDGDDASVFVDVIRARCANLSRVAFGMYSPTASSYSEKQGVRSIVFDADMEISDRSFHNLLRTSQDTLEELLYVGSNVNDDNDATTMLVRLPRLRKLTLSYMTSKPLCPTHLFLSSCAALDTLQLAYLTLTPSIIDAILLLPYVRTLSLWHCSAPRKSAYRLFRGLASLPHSRLQELSVVWKGSGHYPADLLKLVGDIRSLTHLRFHTTGPTSKTALDGFVRSARAPSVTFKYVDVRLADTPDANAILEPAFYDAIHAADFDADALAEMKDRFGDHFLSSLETV
ncbi:hypothetical protein BCR43DRAFT_499300 [Syncephalastrum racemosum]|uniref:F-box domain-containing protein n=1 Tax=Syncephalastrum racemosum TaxID=13706 RepID=A0A1X2H1A6_SYNRA|nr:hypothetical protein BCR43DRAFT_499300 [Syncephalastrum racemosum]